MTVETLIPPGTHAPIGPYSHIARAGGLVWVSGTAAIDPASGALIGDDAYSQTRQIIALFRVMLEAAGSDLGHVTHVNVYLRRIEDFGEMNRAYAEGFGRHRPARTAVAVDALPKEGALLTMSLVAVARE